MLWTILLVLLMLWALGLVSGYTLGGLVHILLVVGLVDPDHPARSRPKSRVTRPTGGGDGDCTKAKAGRESCRSGDAAAFSRSS